MKWEDAYHKADAQERSSYSDASAPKFCGKERPGKGGFLNTRGGYKFAAPSFLRYLYKDR